MRGDGAGCTHTSSLFSPPPALFTALLSTKIICSSRPSSHFIARYLTTWTAKSHVGTWVELRPDASLLFPTWAARAR